MKKGKILAPLMLTAVFNFTAAMYLPTDVYADGQTDIFLYHSTESSDEDPSGTRLCPLCTENHYDTVDTYAEGSTHRFWFYDNELPEGYTTEWRQMDRCDEEYFSFEPHDNYCDVTFLKCSGKYESDEGENYYGLMFGVSIYDSNGNYVCYGYDTARIAESDYIPQVNADQGWTADSPAQDSATGIWYYDMFLRCRNLLRCFLQALFAKS